MRLVWLVDPFHEYVIVHSPDDPVRLFPPGSTLDGGDVLPGFELPLEQLFG